MKTKFILLDKLSSLIDMVEPVLMIILLCAGILGFIAGLVYILTWPIIAIIEALAKNF